MPGGAAGGGVGFALVVVDEREIGFFLGEGCALEGGLVDWVESEDLPRDMAVDFFFSVRADPIGRTEGNGSGKAELLFLSETMLPIFSDLVPLTGLLAGTVLTEMFLPHPAELGKADADMKSANSHA